MNSKFCQDTLVGIPEYLQKHQHLLLSIVELTIFYIAKVRFSRILSHPFWYKSHVFDQRKDEFENLSRYACWHTRVLSKTPAPVSLHRRAYHILHCKCTIFPKFVPSLLIQKSFYWPEKRWMRNSVKIHLLAYQSTFKNTSTCCSPSKSFPYFTLQMCDFPEFWAIPFKSHFFDQRKDEFENLSQYTCWHTRVLSKTSAPVALHRRAYHILHCKGAIFPNFEPSLSKVIFDRRKDEFETLSRYTCWHTRVLSKTPAPVALHRRAYHILHCKCAIFQKFDPSLLIQKSFYWPEKRWIRKSVKIHLLAYQSTLKNTSTGCSPS